MKILILSSWNERCGVSAYSESLCEELERQNVEVKIAANYKSGNGTNCEDASNVHRCFHTPFLTHQTGADFDKLIELFSWCDVVHIEMETNLYSFEWLQELLVFNRENLKKPVLATLHSNALWHGFDPSLISHYISHEPIDNFKTIVIPMGLKFESENFDKIESYNSITSFGLGRNNDDHVREAISVHPLLSYSPQYGSNKWLSREELVKNIQKHWIITLMYPPIGVKVSSSAIGLACSTNRPVVVSNTNWFDHVRGYPAIYFVNDVSELRSAVNYLSSPNNREEIIKAIQERKDKFLEEGRHIEDFSAKHLLLYNKIINSKA